MIGGKHLADLRNEARQQAWASASSYFASLGEPQPSPLPSWCLQPRIHVSPQPWILAGHQPELFHPGVWIKCFVLNGLAKRLAGIPLNLLIDTDSARRTSLRFPSWKGDTLPPRSPPAEVTTELVPFDRWSGELPYEERPVIDEQFLADFPKRSEPIWRKWPFQPLLPEFWKHVADNPAGALRLGDRLSHARRAVERLWHCHNWEAPASAIGTTDAFRWFTIHLLSNLARFHEDFNSAIREFRTAHRIRSRSHPFPELQQNGAWLEAPLWGWTHDRPNRERVFVRHAQGSITLRFGNWTSSEWPIVPREDVMPAVHAWRDWEKAGVKLRSRALLTTLYARMVLADVFIHGIGGAVYDAITDRVIERFYSLPAPRFLVVSATMLLPFRGYASTTTDLGRALRYLRDLHWQPERVVGRQDDAARSTVEEKRAWIRHECAGRSESRQRFAMLRRINANLRRHLDGHVEKAAADLNRVRAELDANAVLSDREYAFCLFPEEPLRRLLTRFL